ncbi:MATE family efflux transporter [Devosia nitrariae]|uniref:MATE family efflux transporter n=1 Tax=Devosia nitrariae TaxID=2071872 RepID=A0ABQ5WA97_9HYPH|nr:MATE family efflux transporter [Devosia nitrariae]GLQ56991.1 MATE family efflux transporter [Devosia nitrariae]
MSIAPSRTLSASTFIAASGSGRRLHLAEAHALLRLATPIALISMVNMGMSVTDTMMVSALFGTDALAAVAVGSDLYSIVFYLCAGVLAGIAPFYTAAVAKADGPERARLERAGWMTAGLLALFAVPLIWLAPAWLEAFRIEQSLLTDGQGYTRAMALTLVPMLGVILYRTILTAAEKPKVFLKVTLAMLPLNAIANYLFMTGVGPVPELGSTGAGVSSLIVAMASLAVLVVVARRSARGSASAPRGKAAPDWRAMADVLRVGIPIGIATVAELGIFLGATLYAATLGAADVAAHTLALRLAGVLYAVPVALLQASMVRMARAESLGDARTGGVLVTTSLTLSAIFGTAIFLMLAAGAEPFAMAFFDDSAAGVTAMRLAVVLVILLGLIEFMVGPGSAAAGLLRGRKDTRAPMIYVLVGHWAIGAPLGIYLCEAQGSGVIGIWIGLAAGTLVTTFLSLARLLASRN